MSVANFDGDGYGDTSGLVYGYETDETDDKEIRKVLRSGYGHLGVSPGDVQPMSSTRSTLDDRLPKQSLPRVDTDGRMDVTQEHRQIFTIDGREALVEFAAKEVSYLHEDGGGESA